MGVQDCGAGPQMVLVVRPQRGFSVPLRGGPVPLVWCPDVPGGAWRVLGVRCRAGLAPWAVSLATVSNIFGGWVLGVELRREFLRLLEEDEEFRMAVLGYLGIRTLMEELRRLAGAVEELQQAVKEQGKAILELQETVREHSNAIKELQETVREQGRAIRELQETVREHGEAIRGLQEAVMDHSRAIRELQETVREQGRAIRELQETVREHSKAILELQETVREHSNAIRELQEAVKEQGKAILELQETVREHGRAIKELQEAVRGLQEVVREHGEAIRGLQVAVAELKVAVGSLGRRMGRDLEKMVLNVYRHVLAERGVGDVDKVESFVYVDVDGKYYRRGAKIEVDVYLHDGDLYLLEVKSLVEEDDVEWFHQKCGIVERILGRQARKHIIVGVNVAREAHDLARRLGIEVVAGAIVE